MDENLLVGYIRKCYLGRYLKLSINAQSFKDCEIYTTSDGQQWISLKMVSSNVRKVMEGQRAVTTIYQELE
jgi:hypothetical protein